MQKLADAITENYTLPINKAAIQRYEAGTAIPATTLFVLADYFDWSIEAIAHGFVVNSKR